MAHTLNYSRATHVLAGVPMETKRTSSGWSRDRASFLARMGAMPGPMAENGKPTRLALALRAWGASSKEDARAKANAISARNK